MTIYIPVAEFKNGDVIHGITSVEAEECRKLKSGSILHRGTIYGDCAYTSPEAVEHYWNKEYWKARPYEYKF